MTNFLVPYSPELNPIEGFFSMIKARFKTIRVAEHSLDIITCVDRIFVQENNFSNECCGFFRHVREWLVKAIRSELF